MHWSGEGTMNLTTVVEVCISMAFLYLVLSLMVTVVNEIIATLTSLRSRDLSKIMVKLIDHPETLNRFYQHGLIKNAINAANGGKTPATEQPRIDEAAAASAAASDKVATVPEEAATDATVVDGAAAEARKTAAAENKVGKKIPAVVPQRAKHSSYLDSRSFATALLASLFDKNKPIPIISDIKTSVEDLPDSGIKDMFVSAITNGQEDITKIRDELAQSFDAVMDRLSGDYKRKLRWISIAVGFAIAAALNVDSFALPQSLWLDTDMREKAVTAAERFSEEQYDQAVKECTPQAALGKVDEAKPVAASTSANPEAAANPGVETEPTQLEAISNCMVPKLSKLYDGLNPFPIGWANRWPSNVLEGVLKFLGILWTGLALSLGAPFWFDTLQRFVDIRATGKKPEPKAKA